MMKATAEKKDDDDDDTDNSYSEWDDRLKFAGCGLRCERSFNNAETQAKREPVYEQGADSLVWMSMQKR